jgi:hypothetical protein
MKTLEIIAIVYIVVNIFLSGVNYERAEHDTLFMRIGSTLLVLLIGVLLVLFGFLIELLKWIDEQTQIKFFFLFYFTNEFDNLDKERLESVYKQVIAQRAKSGSFKDKLIVHCMEMVNKRNNYTFIPQNNK